MLFYIRLTITYTLSALIMVWYFCEVLEPRKSRAFAFWNYFLILTVVGLAFLPAWDKPHIKTLPVLALQFVLLQWLFKSSVWKKLLVFFSYSVILLILELSSYLAFPAISSDIRAAIQSPKTTFFQIGIVLVEMIIFSFMPKLFKKQAGNALQKTDGLMVLFFVLFVSATWLIVVAIFTEGNYSTLLIAEFLCFVLLMSVFSVWMVLHFKKTAERDALLQYAKKQVELQGSQYRSMKAQYEKVRRLKHDFTGHIGVIGELNARKKYEELDIYLGELRKDASLDSSVTFCSRNAVDAVLANEYAAAKDNGIDIQISVFGLDDLPVSDIDLYSIFYNLLQNAIEACQRMDGGKIIRIHAVKRANCYAITMKNSSLPESQALLTQKNKDWHGLGLSIIRDTAKKYDGHCSFYYQNGEFISVVTLVMD